MAVSEAVPFPIGLWDFSFVADLIYLWRGNPVGGMDHFSLLSSCPAVLFTLARAATSNIRRKMVAQRGLRARLNETLQSSSKGFQKLDEIVFLLIAQL